MLIFLCSIAENVDGKCMDGDGSNDKEQLVGEPVQMGTWRVLKFKKKAKNSLSYYNAYVIIVMLVPRRP